MTIENVHRFTRTDSAGRTVPDTGYADLTLAMRSGDNPGAVFDALLERGQIRLHPDAAALQQALTAAAVACYAEGQQPAVVVDTTAQAVELSAAIRQRLLSDGRVDDRRVAVTGAGQRIGAGDRIATRRNDPNLDVANRDIWTVTTVGTRGGLLVTPAGGRPTDATPAAAEQRVLPPDYVTAHVELAYATTAHGVQGDTVTAAHLVIAEHTGAASAYVGMTRGRTANTAHLIATDRDDGREQWIAVFARDRADLGPAHAAELAAREAARYVRPRPLDQVVAELHSAWTTEQRCLDRLSFYQPQRDGLRQIVALEAGHTEELARSEAGYRRAVSSAEQARQRAEASGAAIAAQADRIREALLRNWDGERDTAHAAAQDVNAGPGRLRLRRAAITRSSEHLTNWANRWRHHLPSLPTDPAAITRVARRLDDRPALCAAFEVSARRAAERSHPEQATLRAAADAAQKAQQHAWRTLTELRRQRDDRLDRFGSLAWLPDPERRLADVERDVATTMQGLSAAQARITQLRAEPAILAQPTDRLTQERDAWRARREVERSARRAHAVQSSGPKRAIRVPPPPPVSLGPRPGAGPHIGR